MLNMDNFKMQVGQKDNTIVVNGIKFLANDADTKKILAIIGAQNTKPHGENFKKPEKPDTSKAKVVPDKFPNLGVPTKSVGKFTFYQTKSGVLVRFWESGFCPKNVKFALKSTLKECGATWDAENGAYKLTAQQANELYKAQVEYEKQKATK